MRNRQWIRIQLPDIKSLSIPIKITKINVSSYLADHEKNLLADLSDDENKKDDEDSPVRKKRKKNSIDPIDVFTINPEPVKNYSLDTNSSTLALSNNYILLHDSRKLILYDYHRQLNEILWNDNDYGLFLFLFLFFCFIYFVKISSFVLRYSC